MRIKKMEKKILDLLLEMNSEIKGVKNEMQSMKTEIKNLNARLNKLGFEMEAGFETLEIKIDEVNLNLRKSNKRLSEQIAANMESIENLKN